MLRTSTDKIKENGCELTKKRSRRYPTKTVTDANYADDITILTNSPTQAETLLHSLERAAACINLHVKAHKTEYMRFNQTGDISTLNGSSLKLVDKFTYLGSSVSSTEADFHTQITKAWTAINRSRDELIKDVLLWTPSHGRAKAWRPARTYMQQLCEDTECSPEDQPEAMNDRERWRESVWDIRAEGTTRWWWWYIYIYIYIYIYHKLYIYIYIYKTMVGTKTIYGKKKRLRTLNYINCSDVSKQSSIKT